MRLDGYTSDAEYRSAAFSPPPVRRFYEYRTEEKSEEAPRKPIRKFFEQQSFDSTSSVEQQKPAVLMEHRESQTVPPTFKVTEFSFQHLKNCDALLECFDKSYLSFSFFSGNPN